MAEADLRLLLRTIADTSGAEKTSQALRRVQQDMTRTNTVTQQMVRGLAASAAGYLSVTTAASALGAIFGTSINAQRENERVTRATTAAYGGQAVQFTRFAETLSAQTGFTSQAILEAALSARTLSANYGLSIEQTQRLIRVSADLARVRGIGVAESFERIQSAIRGEAEASEYLGLTLNDTFLKNQAMNGSLRQTYERMTDAEKAQVRYNELLRQTEQFTGLATSKTQSLDVALGKASNSANKLALEFGQLLAGPTIAGLQKIADLMDLIAGGGVLGMVGRGLGIGANFIRPSDYTLERDRRLQARLRALSENVPPVAPIREMPSASGAFATERAAAARAGERQIQTLREIALLDQVDAAVREITSAQQRQLDLQRESVDLAAQEAAIRLQMLPTQQRLADLQRQTTEQQIRAQMAALPASERLEDLRFEEQRLQLILRQRGIPVEERSAARRELRALNRGPMAAAELDALMAGRGVTLAGRAATRVGLDQQLFDLTRDRTLSQIQVAQETNNLLGQIANQRTQAIQLTINLSGEGFSQQVYKELIEAEKQAQTPPTIPNSGVRR